MTTKQQIEQQLIQKGWKAEHYDSDEHGCWIYFVSLDKKSNINHMQVASTDIDKLHLISNHYAELPIEGAVFNVESELKKIIKNPNFHFFPNFIIFNFF